MRKGIFNRSIFIEYRKIMVFINLKCSIATRFHLLLVFLIYHRVVQISNINHGEHKGNHEGTRRILWTNTTYYCR